MTRYIPVITLSLLCFSCQDKDTSASAPNLETEERTAVEALSPVQTISADTPVSFNEHIQPILSANCYHCHGPDSGSRQPEKNPLRLDIEEHAFAKRENGKPVIIKGNPDDSYLIELLESKDKEQVMPPHPDKNPHGKVMKPEEIALIRRWVKEGAKYEAHWAYIQPKKEPLPETKLTEWVRSPIDHFAAAKLEQAGLKPNDDEDKARLMRRLHFDLTGLQPAPEELSKILADTRDWDVVYKEVVDRLLKTDAYAEQWTRHWLDVARYADTHGIHIDNYRSIWPYRDWVLNAFKTNMPFDQFSYEQIAGDMIPNATQEQKIASGWGRCLPTTGEGGAIAEEYFAIYAQDRVDTTASTWLGLTTGCAACHDHKFDAISTKENYQLTAFYRNTTMSALDGNNANHPPNLLVKTKEKIEQEKNNKIQLAKLHAELKTHRQSQEPAFKAWHAKNQGKQSSPAPTPGLVIDLPLSTQANGLTEASGKKHTSLKPLTWVPSNQNQAVQLTGGNAVNLGNSADFERDQAFSYGAWIKLPHGGSGGIIAKMNAPSTHQGYDLWLEGNQLAAHFIHNWPANFMKVRTKAPFPNNKWFHAFVTYDGSSNISGIKIYINGKAVPVENQANKLTKTIRTKVPLLLGKRNNTQPTPNLQIHGVKIFNRSLTPPEVRNLADARHIETLLAYSSPSPAQLNELREYYFQTVDKKTHSIQKRINALNTQKAKLAKQNTYTLVMQEKPKAKPFAHILTRGQYASKAEKVYPDVPAALPPMAKDTPRNRLGLAKWITRKDNPLPARVTVNRYWYYFFGKGIVETTGDFGVMGARPTHPKLLDWLAVDFVESGWDLRHLVRTIVTSSTYRQSAQISEEKLRRDPLNKLLSRGPRYRLDAEQI
ncbi:MAG: DUF1549 domain-containing protein, partial [Akkermansiaceae bacterium]